MSLLRFQQELVRLYTGKPASSVGLMPVERRALSGIDQRALKRYIRGLKLKRRALKK